MRFVSDPYLPDGQVKMIIAGTACEHTRNP